ncbi:MAG: ABC transporter ATP-binding protein [Bacteroidetes bacterium]|nr:ABC transporter ATP-binding protein [Bacteroidota bacterium]
MYQGKIIAQATNKINELIKQNSVENNASTFLFYLLEMVLLTMVSGFFLFLTRQTIIVMSRHIEFEQKNQLFAHYQKMHTGFFKTNTTGDLMNRLSDDIAKVRMCTGPAIMYIANTFITMFIVLIFMLNVNASLTMYVFAPLPILSVFMYVISNRINKQSQLVQEQLSVVTTHTQESFSSIRVIKAYARELFFENKMNEIGLVYRKKALKLAAIEALFGPMMVLMIGLSVLFVVWKGGTLSIEGKIKPGNITEFIFYVYKLTWPFASLGWVTSLIQRAEASQKRLNEFLKIKPDVNDDLAVINSEPSGIIKFDNVSFTYPENNLMALKNISFEIKQGQFIGITGSVGSGKSTILNLLTRAYNVNTGEIKMNNENIKHYKLHALRKYIAVIPQDIFLFSDTIKNNILFGIENKVDDFEIIEVCKLAGILNDIEQFPQKFETIIGEKGVTLSGGQKQRLSIARALIDKTKKIILIDDALSAVDTETEAHVLSGIQKISNNYTVIMVSNRYSALSKTNMVICLSEGSIIEIGTPDELMKNKEGYLFNLSSIQRS